MVTRLSQMSPIGKTTFYVDGELVEDSDTKKHDGKFKAQIFLSDQAKEVYKAWNNGPANKVNFGSLPSVKSGSSFEAIIVFSGCKENKKGNCVITGDWSINRKDGSILGKLKDSPIYSGPKGKIENQLMISTNGAGLVASAADEGYVFKVKIKDKVARKKVELTASVNVE